MTDEAPPPPRCRYPDLYPYACPAGCYCGRTVATVHLPPHPDDRPTRGAAVIEFACPFVFQRDTDITGVSGTGTVADGVIWPDGSVAVRWRGERPSTVVWGSLADAVAVHGHDGATRVVWADAPTTGDDDATTGADDEPVGPPCDHMEPGTPCDWDRCAQPERLARGDAGSTPPTPVLDALRAGQRVWRAPIDYGTGHMLGLVATLNGTQCTDADPCPLHAARPTPGAKQLRRWYTAALTREHHRRARERIVASPEEHCAAMADAIMTVRDAEMDQLAAERDELRHLLAAAEERVERTLADRERMRLEKGELRQQLDAAGLPPATACTKHTGADRQHYGCTGPDPQES